ncbi:MAG: CehA/McbA family metallohydrolase [Trueperaceae bacterium]
MAFHFEGSLTAEDQRTTRVFAFEVPAGTTNVNVRLRYEPVRTEGAELPQQINLTVNGPRGWVAEVNRAAGQFEEGTNIGPHPSAGTPPTLVEPGAWSVFLNTHRVVDVTATFRIDVTFEASGDEVVLPPVPEAVVPTDKGPGWYRGDLHAHTWHSDGRWGSADLVAYMRGRGLDFTTLTDHNTVTGLPEHFHLASDDLLTLGGSEMSTFHGHMLALGVHERIEWRRPNGSRIPVPEIAAAIHAQGGLSVICHPRNVGDPWCCGCRWEHDDMMPGNARAVEIWNGVWKEENREGVALWQSWLSEGHRLVATAGSDHHGMPHHVEEARRGRPAANVVYADGFTREAILAGLARGSSYVSAGPTLRFEAVDANGRSYRMGEVAEPGSTLRVACAWHDVAEGARVELVVDGRRERLGGASMGSAAYDFAVADFRWATLEVWDDQGAWAISNPLYGRR